MVGDGSGFLERRVGRDHLAGDKVLADAEMLERALGLRAPEFVGGYLDDPETICLCSHVGHRLSPSAVVS
jgi:hypothetical protein